MSQIRKRTLKATWWIYTGFLIGAINVYLFTNLHWFSAAQYGLTTSLRELSMLVCGLSALGVTSFLYKFSLLRRQPGAAKKRYAWPCFKGCIVWLYCHVVYFIYFKTAGNPKIQRKFTFIGGVFLLHYSHGFLHPAFPGAGGLLL